MKWQGIPYEYHTVGPLAYCVKQKWKDGRSNLFKFLGLLDLSGQNFSLTQSKKQGKSNTDWALSPNFYNRGHWLALSRKYDILPVDMYLFAERGFRDTSIADPSQLILSPSGRALLKTDFSSCNAMIHTHSLRGILSAGTTLRPSINVSRLFWNRRFCVGKKLFPSGGVPRKSLWDPFPHVGWSGALRDIHPSQSRVAL